MTTGQDPAESLAPVQEKTGGNFSLTLDWWAVIFALALTVLVLIGLQVPW